MAHEILGIPADPAHNPRFARMAHVYSHMFTNAPPVFKDMWGSYFFEAWALTLLILLQVRESFAQLRPPLRYAPLQTVPETLEFVAMLTVGAAGTRVA